MKSCRALYFPGSRPHLFSLELFLLVHDVIWSYAYAGNFSVKELEPFCKAGLLNILDPAPLGANQERFDRLVYDILAHGEDLLEVSRSSVGMVSGMESGWDIVSYLTDDAKASDDDKNLWQARLFLKLHEKLCEQEKEANQSLAELAARQEALLLNLRDSKEEVVARYVHEQHALHTPERYKQLLRSWNRLFFADRSLEKPFILVTDQPGVASSLLSCCEKVCKVNPQSVMEFSLPDIKAMDPEIFLRRRESFLQKASSCLDDLRQELCLLSTTKNDMPSMTEDVGRQGLAERWNYEIMANFNEVGISDLSLVYYRLAGVSIPEILARYSRREIEEGSDETPVSGLLAVLEKKGAR